MRAARWTGVAVPLLLAVVLLGGCGPTDPPAVQDAGGSPPAPTGSASTAPSTASSSPSTGAPNPPTDPAIPTLDIPRGAPRTPSDLVPTEIVAGTIRGGDGSCYTLETDNGPVELLVGEHADQPGETIGFMGEFTGGTGDAGADHRQTGHAGDDHHHHEDFDQGETRGCRGAGHPAGATQAPASHQLSQLLMSASLSLPPSLPSAPSE